MTEQRKIPRNEHGQPFYEAGDLVTRDGTDVHRVVSHNGSEGYPPDGFTVVCVKAPASGWTEVGEEEFNICSRYSPVEPVDPPQTCQTCGRPLPRTEDDPIERQACGRLAIPVPHVGLCFPIDNKGGHLVRWSSRPVQTSRNAPRDEAP
ncbi:hypothetical protein ASF22_19880 [Methylobacterium sp. Leaf87]|uniref:hypothetical protein n=1 Tax=Methylobacterium sp. Leaf87 TaxID=1736243 RepID=UPI0006F3A212|nr:hypothetical protein [Methylobacterium sp. Leaf87]KQO68511.1 hypothetical protein ASF22_19880 [Methylobacterium sp. Leaf87]